MQRRILAVVPILILSLGVLNLVITLSATTPTNFRAWTYAGTSIESVAAIGMLIGYRFMFKAASNRASDSASRQCLQGGLMFLAVSLFWNVRSLLAIPPHATLREAIEFSVLTLMTTLYLGWLDTVHIKRRRSGS